MKNNNAPSVDGTPEKQPREARWVWRLVSWWRRITGRDRYHVGIDYAKDGEPDHWCKAVYDTKTGVTTILEMGRGEPPANTKISHAPLTHEKRN